MRTPSRWSRFTISRVCRGLGQTRRIAHLPVSRRDEGANDRYQYEETASDHAYHANGPARSVRRCVRNREKWFETLSLTKLAEAIYSIIVELIIENKVINIIENKIIIIIIYYYYYYYRK